MSKRIDHDCTPQERNVLLDRIAELESQVEAACASPAGCEEQKRIAKLTQRNDELRSTLKAYLATIKRLEAKVADREASKAEAEANYSDVVAGHENELALRLEAEAALAERDRMLDVAYADYAEEWHDGDPQFVQHDRWLADLKARAEEGTSEDTYAGQCWGGADTPDERARAEEGSGDE